MKIPFSVTSPNFRLMQILFMLLTVYLCRSASTLGGFFVQLVPLTND